MVLLKTILFTFVLLLVGCSQNPQNIIKENYYTSKKNISLDKYTKVLKASEADEFSRKLNKAYKGLGITLVKLFGKIYVFIVVKDSSAYFHDIQKGDILLSVNNKSIKNSTLEQIYREIKKFKNGVNLTFYRKNKGKFSVFLKKQKIDVKNVEYRLNSKVKVYIHIKNFAKGVTSEVKKILEANKQIKLITFDLRDNGGGVFEEALKLADLFIEKGVLLFEKGKNIDKKYYATSKVIDRDFNIRILVNHNTASASEIFAGIMQDYKKAVIVGEKTYGKGCIQKLYKLDNGKVLKVTVSEYFLPSGRSINEVGLTPDLK